MYEYTRNIEAAAPRFATVEWYFFPFVGTQLKSRIFNVTDSV